MGRLFWKYLLAFWLALLAIELSVEDSTGFMHASDGVAEPAEATLRSEASIVAAIAEATLAPMFRLEVS